MKTPIDTTLTLTCVCVRDNDNVNLLIQVIEEQRYIIAGREKFRLPTGPIPLLSSYPTTSSGGGSGGGGGGGGRLLPWAEVVARGLPLKRLPSPPSAARL